MGYVIRARPGRPGLAEDAVVDLAEAAAIRAGVDLAVVASGNRTIALKDPIYEVTLVQHLVQYLLMYQGLDRFNIGWEYRVGRESVDIAMRSALKTVLIECKDFSPGWVNQDARKLRRISSTFKNPSLYVLAFWRGAVPRNIPDRVRRHYQNARGLDSSLSRLVSHKTFQVYRPARQHSDFAVGLFKVLV